MRRYLDIRLMLFSLLAILASLISAHGAWVFFGYLVDPWLAAVFTVVIALGIIGLDAAATLEKQRAKRYGYLAGMLLFLGMETLANYFAGQASFVTKVQGALAGTAPAADLLAITKAHPVVTRALVVLFLSLASIAVAAFVFAASLRVAQIRSGATTALVDRLRRMLGRRRAVAVNMARELRKVRKEAAQWVVDLKAERDSAARLRTTLDRLYAILSSRRLLIRNLARNLRDTRAQLKTLAQAHDDTLMELRERDRSIAQAQADLMDARALSAQQTDELAQLRATIEERDRKIAHLQQEAAQPIAIDGIDVLAVARKLRDKGVASRETADLLRISESTLRYRLKETNGHHKEN